MIKKIFLILFISITYFLAHAQSVNNYEIEINIQGNQDTVLYLANYYGDKTYLSDTAYNENGKGVFVFSKEEELEGGLYIIVSQEKKSLFEFLVADSRKMEFETSGDDFVVNMKVRNSLENEVFYKYLKFSGELYDKVKPINVDLKRLGPDTDSSKILQENLKTINMEMVNYKEFIMQEHPDSFLTSFLV